MTWLPIAAMDWEGVLWPVTTPAPILTANGWPAQAARVFRSKHSNRFFAPVAAEPVTLLNAYVFEPTFTGFVIPL